MVRPKVLHSLDAPWGNMASEKLPPTRSESIQKLGVGHCKLVKGPEGIWAENQQCLTQME